MIAMGDEFAILIDREVRHVIGGQLRFWVERSSEGVRTKANVMGCTTCVNDSTLTIWQGLVKAEACEAIGKSDNRRGQKATSRAGGIEAVPLRDHTCYKQHDKGGMKDKR